MKRLFKRVILELPIEGEPFQRFLAKYNRVSNMRNDKDDDTTGEYTFSPGYLPASGSGSNNPRKHKRRKRTNGGSFDDMNSPVTEERRRHRRNRSKDSEEPNDFPTPTSTPKSPNKRRRRKKKESADNSNTHENFSNNKKSPINVVNLHTDAVNSNYPATPNPNEGPPPGLKRKKKRGRKRRQINFSNGLKSLFAGVNFSNMNKYETPYNPPKRRTNRPDLELQDVDGARTEIISLSGAAEIRMHHEQVAGRNLFSTTLNRIATAPRQISTNVFRMGWMQEQEIIPQSVDYKEEQKVDRCCPPCFYQICYLAIIIIGIAILTLALKGKFDE